MEVLRTKPAVGEEVSQSVTEGIMYVDRLRHYLLHVRTFQVHRLKSADRGPSLQQIQLLQQNEQLTDIEQCTPKNANLEKKHGFNPLTILG